MIYLLHELFLYFVTDQVIFAETKICGINTSLVNNVLIYFSALCYMKF